MLKKLITFSLTAMAVYGCVQNDATVTKNSTASNTPLSTKAYAQKITGAFQVSGVTTTQGHYYGKVIMNELANLSGVETIHVFNALDDDGRVRILFKATDSKKRIVNQEYAVDVGTGYPPTVSDPGGRNSAVANVGGKLEDQTAQQWAASFKNNYAQRASVFSFSASEFKKILATDGAEGIVFLYGLDNGTEYLVAGAIDGKVNVLWDEYLSVSAGEKSSGIYPVEKSTSVKN